MLVVAAGIHWVAAALLVTDRFGAARSATQIGDAIHSLLNALL
jgi:hypothetical protein